MEVNPKYKPMCRPHTGKRLFPHNINVVWPYRFKKLEVSSCVDCQEPVDNAEHTLFKFDRW